MLPRLPLLLVVASAWSAVPVAAQCTTVWSPGSPQPELTGVGKCTTLWDPDGAGPEPQRFVVGGTDLRAGNEPPDRRVMTWDGSRWQALGSGPGTNASGRIDALTVWNGQLVAGGTFAGGGVDYIALWDGAAWQPLGAGFPTTVTALAQLGGDLVAAGTNGIVPVIQRWNGATWTALPAPPLLQHVFAITQFQGQLCVGGSRTSSPAGGVLERWNGTSWQPSITANDTITCFAVRSFSLTSSLFVGGRFTSIGGVAASRIASTSGSTTFAWNTVGNGLAAACIHLHVRATSALGSAVVACLDGTPVVQLSGSSFVAMGNRRMRSVSYYGGFYHGATDVFAPIAFVYQASTWRPLEVAGANGPVWALTRRGDDIIYGGESSDQNRNIARWTGTTFQTLGGVQGSFGAPGIGVFALLTLDNGAVVVGGLFDQAGASVLAANIAVWNNNVWAPLGAGLDGRVAALCKLPNGDIVAGGSFTFVPASVTFVNHVARWNGLAWSSLGTGLDGAVDALALRSDGTLIAGGAFTTAGVSGVNRIAQWNGTSWLPLGSGFDARVRGLAVLPNDDIVAVGDFTSAGGVPVDGCARWNGTAWTSMGAASGDNAPVYAVFALPNGDVLAGRGFHQPSTNPDAGISRWNGSTWSGIGTGLVAPATANSAVVGAFAQRADGSVVVGGTFDFADGLLSPNLALLSSPCPAAAQPYGAGCSSSVGPLTIVADTLPWIGGTFRTATTGVAPGSFCFGVTGFTQLSIPLQSLLAQGQPGCTLFASPDLVTLLPQDVTGVANSALDLPLNASLIGVPFFQQSVTFEFTGLFVLTAVRSSNALALTIGSF